MEYPYHHASLAIHDQLYAMIELIAVYAFIPENKDFIINVGGLPVQFRSYNGLVAPLSHAKLRVVLE
jgi:hypothetical protein